MEMVVRAEQSRPEGRRTDRADLFPARQRGGNRRAHLHGTGRPTKRRSGGRAGRLLVPLVLTAAAANAQTPVDVPVTAVPITVTSTEADYFVLYVKHELSENDVRHVAVSLTRGKAGTTDLNMTVPGLPAARYKVEKYAVANPADVDGDGKDDIADPNPVNGGKDLELKLALDAGGELFPTGHGLNRLSSTAEWDAIQFDTVRDRCRYCDFLASGTTYVKIVAYPDGSQPHTYFMNTRRYWGHPSFARGVKLPFPPGAGRLELDRETGMAGTDADFVTYYFWFSDTGSPLHSAKLVPLLHSMISANLPIMAAEATKWRLAYYVPDRKWHSNTVERITGSPAANSVSTSPLRA